MSGAEAPSELVVASRMMGVRLVGERVDPQFVNPVTFRLNNVVNEDWVCDGAVLAGITESGFNYANGVRVEAYYNSVSFQHSGETLTLDHPLSVELARRYVAVFGADYWSSVDLEFGGAVGLPERHSPADMSPWSAFTDRMVHRGVAPGFWAGTRYHYPDRTLAVELSPSGNSDVMPLRFGVRVNREAHDIPRGEAGAVLGSVLDGWAQDWDDAVAAVTVLVKSTFLS